MCFQTARATIRMVPVAAILEVAGRDREASEGDDAVLSTSEGLAVDPATGRTHHTRPALRLDRGKPLPAFAEGRAASLNRRSQKIGPYLPASVTSPWLWLAKRGNSAPSGQTDPTHEAGGGPSGGGATWPAVTYSGVADDGAWPGRRVSDAAGRRRGAVPLVKGHRVTSMARLPCPKYSIQYRPRPAS